MLVLDVNYEPFKFIVGPDRIEYYVHRVFLSRLSVPLKDLVNGSTPTDGCVVWEDIDGNVFSRSAQFVYTGRYPNFTSVDRDDPTENSESAIANNPKESIGLVSNTSKPLLNVDDAFVLPYSLTSYQAGATERTLPQKPGLQPWSKRKFDEMGGDCDSNRKRDIIWAFMATDRASDSSIFGPWGHAFLARLDDATKSPKNSFIGNASIYIFAKKYEITALIELSSKTIARALV